MVNKTILIIHTSLHNWPVCKLNWMKTKCELLWRIINMICECVCFSSLSSSSALCEVESEKNSEKMGGRESERGFLQIPKVKFTHEKPYQFRIVSPILKLTRRKKGHRFHTSIISSVKWILNFYKKKSLMINLGVEGGRFWCVKHETSRWRTSVFARQTNLNENIAQCVRAEWCNWIIVRCMISILVSLLRPSLKSIHSDISRECSFKKIM